MLDAMTISKQWASRPMDQRFTTLEELHAFNVAKRARSHERGVPLDLMRLVPEGEGVTLALPDENTGYLNNWAFSQLCQRAHAPAGYLRTLPAALAAIPLQYSLEQDHQDAKLLTRKNGGPSTVDAITSDSYGRIWDAEMSESIVKHIDPTVWKVPVASYAAHDPKKATTLYASDRDCFIALVDDQHAIEVPTTTGGQADLLYRGFIVHNSEVGAATYELFLFLYRFICDNRIIHGLAEQKHLRIRHSSGGPLRFMYQATPALKGYLNAATNETVQSIQRATEKVVAKDDKSMAEWLKQRGFAQGVAQRAIAINAAEPGNPYSLWSAVNGLTAAAHDQDFGDERLDLELKASKLLDAVA